MKPGDLFTGIPWHDGKVIYRSGDAAEPMAIAVTANDAAAIVAALASGGRVVGCLHQLVPGEKSHNPPSFYCEAPSVAKVPGSSGGPRCMEHLASMVGASIVPVDHHPDLWPAVRRLIAVWNLPEGPEREAWVKHCVGDLAAMRVGFVSRFRDENMPELAREALARREVPRG